MSSGKFTRRNFFHAVLAVGALALPTALGYDFVRASNGYLPTQQSPYAVTPNDTIATDAPLLILVDPNFTANSFGNYLGKILRAEGLVAFAVGSRETLGKVGMDTFDTIILAEIRMSRAGCKQGGHKRSRNISGWAMPRSRRRYGRIGCSGTDGPTRRHFKHPMGSV